MIAGIVVCAATTAPYQSSTQELDFGKIDKFEFLATGTMHVGAPPKTIVDDGERHVVILTIWDADAETKIYWRSPDGDDRTTVILGRGIQTFQTLGEFKLEAVGEPHHEVHYGYVLASDVSPAWWSDSLGGLPAFSVDRTLASAT